MIVDWRANGRKIVFIPYGPVLEEMPRTVPQGRLFYKPNGPVVEDNPVPGRGGDVQILPAIPESSIDPSSRAYTRLGEWDPNTGPDQLSELLSKKPGERDDARISQLRRERAVYLAKTSRGWFADLPQWMQFTIVIVGGAAVVGVSKRLFG